MLKIKDDVDLKELEKFGFKMIPEGIYAKSLKIARSGRDSDMTEWFVTVEKDRTLKKFEVWSYLRIAYYQKEKHLFNWDVLDLIQAGYVEKGRRKK